MKLETYTNPTAAVPGYHGCYLRIDLSSGSSRRVPLGDAVLRRFIGGSGLGVHLLLEEGAASRGALAPEAPIVFAFSPLVGSPLTTSAKFAVVSKSPLTNRVNDSLASSHFALAGKRTGCDALLIVGRAEKPSLLVIDEGEVRLEPAGDLWGKHCREAERLIRERFGTDFHTAVIGPGGERQVRYATISHAGRHAGRGGSGAVMGAKNLKAILVRGTQRARWADAEGLVQLARDVSQRSFGPATAKYRELGTATNLLVFNRLKALPTHNFQQGSFAAAEALSPEVLSQARTKTRAYCAACTIGCEHIYGFTDGDQQEGVRLEYENLFALGPLCGVSDPDVVLRASRLCDDLGIDTISAGGTIAFAMECVERGLLDGSWLRFGDGAALLRVLEQIGRREGLGDQLAEGSRRLAQRIGHDSISFAPQVKGLEIPGYEPRSLQTMALGFAVGTRGADHNRSGAYEADFGGHTNRKRLSLSGAALAMESEDKATLMDCLILCKFLRGVFEDVFAEGAQMLRLATGWKMSADELRQVARRVVTAKKLFNIQAGWTPDEDQLPRRFLDQPLEDDREARLDAKRLGEAIAAYNLHRGWSAEGWLDHQLLQQLELVPATGPTGGIAAAGQE